MLEAHWWNVWFCMAEAVRKQVQIRARTTLLVQVKNWHACRASMSSSGSSSETSSGTESELFVDGSGSLDLKQQSGRPPFRYLWPAFLLPGAGHHAASTYLQTSPAFATPAGTAEALSTSGTVSTFMGVTGSSGTDSVFMDGTGSSGTDSVFMDGAGSSSSDISSLLLQSFSLFDRKVTSIVSYCSYLC